MTCTIRGASIADATRLAAFGRRVFETTFTPDNDAIELERYLATAYTPEAQTAELGDPTITTLLGCGADDALLAFAQLRSGPRPPCISDPSAVELWRFYVDHPWHGRGVAAVLMQATFEAAASAGARGMWLGVWERNLRAQAFYRKWGFEPVGTHVFMFGTEAQTDQIWTRALQ